MYAKRSEQPEMANLPLFLNDTLNPDNRWIKLATLIPWNEIDKIYANNFESKLGPGALPSRIAFGALIIQTKLGLTDEETVEQLSENPYLQYFIGLSEFKLEKPFDSSMMTHFRKRFKSTEVIKIDDLLHQLEKKKKKQKSTGKDDDGDNSPPQNKGKLIVDATCAPADVTHPTDLGLLNKARLKTEKMIDILWSSHPEKGVKNKPRSYRRKGRQAFSAIIKQKRPGKKKIRAAIRIQLSCVNRNLRSINRLLNHVSVQKLGSKLHHDLLVINTLYEQQQQMFDKRKHSIEDRIVSISQPHIRPIVRGKAKAATEFGAKVSISLVDGWSFVDTINFDAYNEGVELKSQIKKYHQRFGHYPESVHADKIYRNRENRKFCKEHNIRLSGPKLGRNTADHEKLKAENEQVRADEGVRSAVEGRFGVGKRRYSLDRIMAKLENTSATVIALIFLVMNLDQLVFLRLFFDWLFHIPSQLLVIINDRQINLQKSLA